jgi:hypothetical protein
MSEHSKNVGVEYCEQCKREYRNKLLEDLVVIIQKRLDRLQEYSDEDPVKKMLLSLQEETEGEFSAVEKDSKNFNKGQITGSYKKPHVGQTLDELQMWERQQGR